MSSGGRNDYFRDCGEHPRKRPQWKPHARRVCWRHGPRAPSLGPLCGRGHRPRAPILPKDWELGRTLKLEKWQPKNRWKKLEEFWK